MLSIDARGRGAPHRVPGLAIPVEQRSVRAGEEVYTRVLSSSSYDYSGCGVAGCSQGTVTNQRQGLVLAGLHGGHPRLVTRGGYDSEPAFSPDGSVIAYVSHRRPRWAQGMNIAVDVIALMDADGRQLGVVAAPGRDEEFHGLMWSPDSRSIAYERFDQAALGASAQIVIRNLATGHRRVLSLPQPLRDLAWSPNGKYMVGVRDRQARLPGSGPAQYIGTGGDLWLVSLRTGVEKQLTYFAPEQPINFVSFCGNYGGVIPEVAQPRWSPDSRQIAYTSTYGYIHQLGDQQDIRVTDVATRSTRTVYHPAPMTCLHTGGEWLRGSYQAVSLLGWT